VGDVTSQVVLVTDVSGHLGQRLVAAALRSGASRVYACAPSPVEPTSRRVIPVLLDADSVESVRRLCTTAADATVMVSTSSSPNWPPVSVSGGDTDALIQHISRTVLRPIRIAAALAPTLAANGGGVIACVESVQAWINLTGAFAVAQSALWSAVNALRVELRPSGVHVLGAVGAFDEAEQLTLDGAAQLILRGIRERANEIVLDDYSAGVRRRLSGPIELLYPEVDR
jgi:NAD(P)-dependent dehydrogenase (short-subunit alcohol dehydrogenase family)